MLRRRLRLGGAKSTFSEPENPPRGVLPLAGTWCLTNSILSRPPAGSLERDQDRDESEPVAERAQGLADDRAERPGRLGRLHGVAAGGGPREQVAHLDAAEVGVDLAVDPADER